MNAVATDDDERAVLFMDAGVRVGMQMKRCILRFNRIGTKLADMPLHFRFP